MSTSMEQVARLLSEIPYIQARPGITLHEIAEVFSIPVAQVKRDLAVAIFCGLPGGYPSDLIDVDLDVMDDEGVVYLSNPTALDRPTRFTVTEAASLQLALTALRSLVAPDTAAQIDDLVARIAVAPSVDMRLATAAPGVRDVISSAISSAERIELTYEGQARGQVTRPVVDPAAIFLGDGVAYLTAYSLTSDGWRTYRLDRVVAASPTGEAASDHGARPSLEEWPASLTQSDSVTVLVTPSAGWIAEYYPTRSVVKVADGFQIELPVVSPSWLIRLLLSLGDHVRSIAPIQYARAVSERARQALSTYNHLDSL
ncbi:MAG: WYL domain-containing protein [Propionibacteriaceae bacterium]|jgi:proteasome accessory factor C|nr:WYL domain-containing protein [Propionibacteriaceae bacterium]